MITGTKKFDKASILRTVALLITLINQALAMFGLEALPFDSVDAENIYVFISYAATLVVSVITWWKNNYISRKGLKQEAVLKQEDIK